MAHVIDLNTYALPGPRIGRFARLSQDFANYRVYRATYDQLDALSDRALADLGLSRNSVRDVAHEAVYGD